MLWNPDFTMHIDPRQCIDCSDERCFLVRVRDRTESFSPQDLTRLVRYRKGQTIFQQGAPARNLLIVCRGLVKLSAYYGEGRKLIATVLGPGALLGVEALTDASYRSVAEAAEETYVGFIGREELTELEQDHAELSTALIQELARENRFLLERLQGALHANVQERLAHLLLRLGNIYGAANGNGITLEIDLTREELAQMVGASRETVSRTLSTFDQREWVSTENGSLHLIDCDALRELASVAPFRES